MTTTSTNIYWSFYPPSKLPPSTHRDMKCVVQVFSNGDTYIDRLVYRGCKLSSWCAAAAEKLLGAGRKAMSN